MIEAASAPALAAYFANQLGLEKTRLAETLRQRLWSAGIKWPQWIDARPGRLSAIIGDCSDPPLGRTQEHLLQTQRPLVTEGLAALGLALSAPRLLLTTTSNAIAQSLAAELRATSIEIHNLPPIHPAQPQRVLGDAPGVPWVVSAQTLVAAGAALRGQRAPRFCSVVGAMRTPQVLARVPGETPRQLVRRAGGASTIAWVALVDSAFVGSLWPADKPLSDETSLLYVLPASHALIRRHKGGLRERTRAACLTCQLCTEFCPEAPQGTAPHRVMQALGRGGLQPSTLAAASGCSSCGACTTVCPADLLPSALVSTLAAAMPQREGHDLEEPPPPSAPSRLPMDLVLRRLDLLRYVG